MLNICVILGKEFFLERERERYDGNDFLVAKLCCYYYVNSLHNNEINIVRIFMYTLHMYGRYYNESGPKDHLFLTA